MRRHLALSRHGIHRLAAQQPQDERALALGTPSLRHLVARAEDLAITVRMVSKEFGSVYGLSRNPRAIKRTTSLACRWLAHLPQCLQLRRAAITQQHLSRLLFRRAAYCTSRFRLEFGYLPIGEIRLALGDSYLVKFVHHIPHRSRAIFHCFSI